MKLRFESIFASSKSDSNFSRNKGIAKGANRLCAAKQARRATTSSSFEKIISVSNYMLDYFQVLTFFINRTKQKFMKKFSGDGMGINL